MAAALAVSILMGWRIGPTIALFIVVSICYIATGGVTAVVWTNVFQALMFLGAGLVTLVFLVAQVDGGAAMSRTPEPIRRVTKKKRDAVTWLAWPNRWARNW
jgi:Na+/proline symporter